MKNEFLIAITQLSAEKNLPKEIVLEAVEAALVSAYKKDSQIAHHNISVRIHPTTGDVRVYALKEVVESVSDPDKEISLERARELMADVQLGDSIEVEMTPYNAGRIAAQTAKQVVLQKLREAEREVVFEEYTDREGDIVSGVVQRIEPKQLIIDLGKTEAVLPVTEQVRTERYRIGQRLKVLLLEVFRTNKGPQVIVSRSHPDLVRRLFELEVPEIHNGIVELKSIAREAGYRSKVAVAALREGIDPVGSCVGLRGIRIQNIVNELSGERVDVVQWHADISVLIANALSPAQVLDVEIDKAENTAKVVVPDNRLSLAIGKEGQNARLAAKLTGWRIDIKSASDADAEKAEMEALKEVTPAEEVVEEAAASETKLEEVKVEAPVAQEAEEVRDVEEKAEEEMAVTPALGDEVAAVEVEEVGAMPAIDAAAVEETGIAEEEAIPSEVVEELPVEEPLLEEAEISPEKPKIRFAEDVLAMQPAALPSKTKKAKGKKARRRESEEIEMEALSKPKKSRKRKVRVQEEDEEDEYGEYEI